MGILFRGDYGFQIAGPHRWNIGGFGLDTLVIPYEGSIDLLAAFEATLTKWDPSPIDGDMYLEGWSVSGDRNFPTVEIKYIGCKGGDLDGRTHQDGGYNLSTATYSDEDYTIEVSYLAPYARAVAIKTSIIFASPPTILTSPIFLYGRWRQTTPESSGGSGHGGEELMDYFNSRTITVPTWNEPVPGEFFETTSTVTTTLIPIN